MFASDSSPDGDAALQPPEDNSHYLRAVTDMADHCLVTTQEALYTDRGIKLVDKDVRVDSALYDRLVRYKLRGHIDDHLAVQDMVSVSSLVQEAAAQCEQDTLAYLLVHTLDAMAVERLLAPVRSLVLPHALAFKLTVMREQHRDLYIHSVRMMLVSVYLGLKSGMSERECVHLVAAALLHDIGTLHLDPIWHDSGTRVTGAGRKELMAHPITAALIVQAQNLYPRSVPQAILEHHECMDGSGYPRGLQGEQISPMGQILLVAEVASAFFEKYANEAAAQRLSLTLRMSHRKFPAALVACLLPALNIRAVQASLQVTSAQVHALVELLSQTFADWQARSSALAPALLAAGSGQACAFVTQRLATLQKTLFEAGSHPQQQAEALAYLEGDEQGLAELALLGREALWQLQSIIDATHSRWPQLHEGRGPGDQAVAQWGGAFTQRMAQAELTQAA
ncbi:HD domain-containing phosphohydrolase [Pulveribacter sp.]|uniref:HD-GYP domain-containing protein n=1 Tax=Pulveribacter sp. TaxID=2678893 RepID=UPI0028A1EC85|nr:HD domain-containing phosphohydrolase [Pulveribacter sp.]